MQDFFKEGILQFVPGCDGAPALKRGTPTLIFLPQKKKKKKSVSQVGVSSHMTNLSDKQASKKKKKKTTGATLQPPAWAPAVKSNSCFYQNFLRKGFVHAPELWYL